MGNSRSSVVEPEVRVSDLNETSSVYDIMVAAPDDNEINIMWLLQSITAGMLACFVGIIFIAMVTDQRLFKSPFNLYISFSMFADVFFMISLAISNSTNYSRRHVTRGQCNFQMWYSQWSLVATCWINVVMAREVHKLLRASKVRRRYSPPQPRTVVLQSLVIYALAATVCGLPFIEFLPLKPRLVHGFVCLPYEYSLASSLFQHLVYVQLQIGIPLIFVIYVAVDIIHNQLLPKRGRRRELGLYFCRICFVFIVCMTPTLVCK